MLVGGSTRCWWGGSGGYSALVVEAWTLTR